MRELDGNKSVLPSGGPPCAQGAFARDVKACRQSLKFHSFPALSDPALASEVQAKLQTVRMETSCPLEIRSHLKIVPLDGYSGFIEISEKRAPSALNGRPKRHFVKSCDF